MMKNRKNRGLLVVLFIIQTCVNAAQADPEVTDAAKKGLAWRDHPDFGARPYYNNEIRFTLEPADILLKRVTAVFTYFKFEKFGFYQTLAGREVTESEVADEVDAAISRYCEDKEKNDRTYSQAYNQEATQSLRTPDVVSLLVHGKECRRLKE